MSTERLAVIGLGKLGLPFVACWAAKGFSVIGVDVNQDLVKSLAAGEANMVEPEVNEMVKEYAKNISATTNIVQATVDADTIFIFVGTPDEGEGKFTTRFVLSACEAIGEALRNSNSRKQIVLVSSVTAGSIDEEIIPALEQFSGKKANEDFDFCYSPVFIALGTMVRDYYNPDLALIGESGTQAGDRLWGLLAQFYDNSNVKVVRTNFVNAELIKLTLSTFITTKISYGNMLAELCQRIPGADATVVAEAIGLDSRVSPKVLKGAMPYGGPCFPRDNRSLLYLTRRWGVDGRLVESTDLYNSAMIVRLVDLIASNTPSKGKVAVLGLTFKADTNVVDESAAMEVVAQLVNQGYQVTVYDPAGLSTAREVLGDSVRYADTERVAMEEAETVFVATPWVNFTSLSESDLGNNVDTVIDMWRILNPMVLGAKTTYIAFGLYHEPNAVKQIA